MRRNWVKWSCYAAPELSGAFRQRPLENVASRAETRVLCPTGKLRCILEASTGLRANSVHQREFSLTGKLRCGQKTSTGWKSHHQRGKWCAGKLWCMPQKKSIISIELDARNTNRGSAHWKSPMAPEKLAWRNDCPTVGNGQILMASFCRGIGKSTMTPLEYSVSTSCVLF